jgi:hypothetical protein
MRWGLAIGATLVTMAAACSSSSAPGPATVGQSNGDAAVTGSPEPDASATSPSGTSTTGTVGSDSPQMTVAIAHYRPIPLSGVQGLALLLTTSSATCSSLGPERSFRELDIELPGAPYAFGLTRR